MTGISQVSLRLNNKSKDYHDSKGQESACNAVYLWIVPLHCNVLIYCFPPPIVGARKKEELSLGCKRIEKSSNNSQIASRGFHVSSWTKEAFE